MLDYGKIRVNHDPVTHPMRADNFDRIMKTCVSFFPPFASIGCKEKYCRLIDTRFPPKYRISAYGQKSLSIPGSDRSVGKKAPSIIGIVRSKRSTAKC